MAPNLDWLHHTGSTCRLDGSDLYVDVQGRRAHVDLATGSWDAAVNIDAEWIVGASGNASTIAAALDAAWEAAEAINEDEVRESLVGGRENCGMCGGEGCGACSYSRRAA